MADEPNPNQVVESPPPAPPPEVEGVDERGVPYKNVAAEMQRKFEEQQRINQQLLEAVSNRQPAPQEPAKSGIDDILKQYKPEDQTALRALFNEAVTQAEVRARTVGYKMMTEVGVQAELQKDPEVLKEALAAYQRLKANPVWAGADDLHVQYTALQEAKAAVAARRPSGGGMPAPVNIPGTRGGGAPPSGGDPKEKFIAKYMSDPEQVAMFHQVHKRDGLDINSEEGRKRFRRVAELAYQGEQSPFGLWGKDSNVGKAISQVLDYANKQGANQ